MIDIRYVCECNSSCFLEWKSEQAWEFVRRAYDHKDRSKLSIIHPDCICKEFDDDILYITALDIDDLVNQLITILHLPKRKK